jgi:hypothetical protein
MLFEFYKHPEWFRLLNRNGFNTDEIEYRLDQLIVTLSDGEKYYKRTIMPQVMKDIHDWKHDGSTEIVEMRGRYLEEQLEEKEKVFKELQDKAIKISEEAKEIPEELINAGAITQKAIRGYKNSLDVLYGRRIGIDDDMIAQAKAFPLERLIEINSQNFALCLWHSDSKPSMFCKKNYVHCFTCGKTGSAVDVYMEIHGCEFKEAVLALNNF